FTDRGERSLTLRPEGTAPICRAYVEHGMSREPQPVKLFTIAPMFRYGAPQKGRFREHWQASIEAIGTDDSAIDAEIIQLYDTLRHRHPPQPIEFMPSWYSATPSRCSSVSDSWMISRSIAEPSVADLEQPPRKSNHH